jgi:hypothetical protein
LVTWERSHIQFTDQLCREEPETFHFLAANDNVPLKSEFKPALKVLSRKPAPTVVQRLDPVTGMAKITVEDEDDEEEQKKDRPSPEELRLKSQREREEKQKRYDEARARILGTTSGTSSPGTTTPPTEESRPNRSRGRGRGNGRQENQRPASQPGNKELFDPSYTPKPGVTIQKRNGEGSRSGHEDQVIRTPRPPGSGKGFGFANRGGNAS